MPIYEFHCGKCDKDSEILVRSSNWEGTPCPHCGSTKLAKKFSTFASHGAGENGACETPNRAAGGGCCGCASGRPHKH
jgi:putative FmdB family regulatory protein